MQKATMPGSLLKETIFSMRKAKSAMFSANRLFSLTFETEAWRVLLRWLATHARIFIPEKWLRLGLIVSVLIEKLAVLVLSSMRPNIELILNWR